MRKKISIATVIIFVLILLGVFTVELDEGCVYYVCHFELPNDIPQVFGFSEYIAGLAVMIIAWTLADYRYRFRLETAPIPIKKISFWALLLLGVLTIATDVWRAENLPVPSGSLLTPVRWQALLALSFVTLFLGWAWFGLMRPSKLGRWNAKRFTSAIQRRVLSSSESELALLADELVSSAEAIVSYTPVNLNSELEGVELVVRDLLFTIADPRFCNVVVSKRPILAIVLYEELGKKKVYSKLFDHLSQNLGSAAFTNADSVLVYETDGHSTGFWGYTRPFTRAFFGNSNLVESVGTMFDVRYDLYKEWGEREWDLYARAILVFFKDRLITRGAWSHSFALHRALGTMIGHGTGHRFDVSPEYVRDSNEFKRFSRSCMLMESIMDFLREQPETEQSERVKGNHHSLLHSISDHAFHLLEIASYVRNQGFFCWEVQHNMAWSSIFRSLMQENRSSRIVQRIVSRKIFDKIRELERGDWPGYDAARMLGLAINILTMTPSLDRSKIKDSDKNTFALRVTTLLWVRHHFSWLYFNYPEVANHALVEKIEYDDTTSRLVINSIWGRGKAQYWELDLFVLPPPPCK